MRVFAKLFFVGVVLTMAVSMIGCSSESGGTPAPAPSLVQQTFDEQCSFCHGPERTEDVAEVHALASNSPTGIIDAVTINMGTGMTTVAFRLFEDGQPLAFFPPNSIRFTLAQLNPAKGSNAGFWQSYINEIETAGSAGPGKVDRVQATYERASGGGVFVDNQDGSYTYMFSFDIRNVMMPVAVPFNQVLTHRLAMQVSDNVDNAIFDFRPDGNPITTMRVISANASCNECHIKLGLHGGDRISLKYCVTCHNPGSNDANSGNSVDFQSLIHKLHTGENLPSVEAGGMYAIWGFGDDKIDFSHAVFPQDTRNCVKCHDGADAATPQGDNWKNVPTKKACGSCHDDVKFATGENHPLPGGIQLNNNNCAGCHPPDAGGVKTAGFPNGANVTDTHLVPEYEAAKRFQYNIISITDTAPGQFPSVTFSVTDPTMGNMPYDILNDPEFTAPAGASRLAVLIGWNTREYTNTGSTSTPAQPISVNPLAGSIDNGDGTFTVMPTAPIPVDVEGSGVVAIEGHPAVESVPGSGDFDIRVPVTGAVQSFAITDMAAQDRRVAVDVVNCNRCHELLSLHGANRSNNARLCVICHNPNATDINRRPGNSAGTADGKAEEAIDFKRLIHAIHGAEYRSKGIVVYGFGGSTNVFDEIVLPSGEDNIQNCEGCHVNDAYELPISEDALPTTISTGDDRSDPNDDTEITPTASVCASCHDGIAAKTHMAEKGGSFDFVAFAPEKTPSDGEDEVALCGPGPINSQPGGHSPRTDCCSCHAVK